MRIHICVKNGFLTEIGSEISASGYVLLQTELENWVRSTKEWAH